MTDEVDAHGLRTAWLTELLCARLGVPHEQTRAIVHAARTHDIGKQLLSPTILSKPQALSRDERQSVEQHAVLGAWLLTNRDKGDADSRTVDVAVALSHHEWWNGQGYPFRLAGQAIPRCARIVAVADVFDALLSPRPYKPAWSQDRALDYITRGSGTQFDPECVDALVNVVPSLPVTGQDVATNPASRPPAARPSGLDGLQQPARSPRSIGRRGASGHSLN